MRIPLIRSEEKTIGRIIIGLMIRRAMKNTPRKRRRIRAYRYPDFRIPTGGKRK